jgi:hypothetical protein
MVAPMFGICKSLHRWLSLEGALAVAEAPKEHEDAQIPAHVKGK